MYPATHPTAWTFKPFQSARSYIPGYGNRSKNEPAETKHQSYNYNWAEWVYKNNWFRTTLFFSKSSKLSIEENEIKVEGEKWLQEVL